jgi:alpha-tubulin suppressor-like RCC1 family protein
MELDTIFVKKVAAGHHSAAVTDTGALYMWGTGVFGEFYTP